MGAIHLNYAQMPERHQYEITGDRGWAILDVNERLLRIGSRATNASETSHFEFDRDDAYKAEHQAFLDAVEKKRSPETPFEEAIISVAFCVAAMRSWETGKPMDLSQYEPSVS